MYIVAALNEQRKQHSANSTAQTAQRKQHSANSTAQTAQRKQHSAMEIYTQICFHFSEQSAKFSPLHAFGAQRSELAGFCWEC
ncbi:hypothetical protein [Methanolapillus millepedarum]|uniref:hypothetical protein n=1 Tax=Methanolapillus millepedarum TaxID=3028296 RepID=UPI0030B8780C